MQEKLDTLTDEEKDIMDKLRKEEEDRIKELDEKQSVKITKTIEQLIQEMNKNTLNLYMIILI